jgi:formylglycine-generating enzyme required for sulfatase activity
MPVEGPDRLAALGFLDAEGERYRLALQRARKWMWELGVPVASERRDGIAKLAAMAAAPEEAERRAARDVASRLLARVVAEVLPEQQSARRQEQEDAALVLGLVGSGAAVSTLEHLAISSEQPVALRRMALEALGLAGQRGSDHRSRVQAFLEAQLRSDALDILVKDDAGWAEHDARLPVLQGASRGLQLAASNELPLLGSGPGRAVPMLTLTALQEGKGLRIRTEVVTPAVWRLPLPDGEQLELVVVEGREYPIGSPKEEAGRDMYPGFRQKCEGVNVEAQRTVNLKAFALVRHPLTQAQWRVVAALPKDKWDLKPTANDYKPDYLWGRFAQPDGLPVDSVSWYDCQEWLSRLNSWLVEQWQELGGQGKAPQLALPSESHWEAACRAGASTPFHYGDTLDASWANYDGGYTYGLGRQGPFRQRPVPIGFFGLVNRWGLAEMHGQLQEWCADQWHRSPMGANRGKWRSWIGGSGTQQELLDGRAMEGPDPELAEVRQEQRMRLLRGGSWLNHPHCTRAAFRFGLDPDYFNPLDGVRPGCFSPPGSLLGA